MTSSPIQPKLLDQVRSKIRVKHYSIRTEQAYVDWIKRFIVHFDKRHPRHLGVAEVEAFLTYLAVEGQVAASTRNQAKSAILFLYREVLAQELPWLDNVERAKPPQHLPVVLTQASVGRASRTMHLAPSFTNQRAVGANADERIRVRIAHPAPARDNETRVHVKEMRRDGF